jgi:hypothetical protein
MKVWKFVLRNVLIIVAFALYSSITTSFAQGAWQPIPHGRSLEGISTRDENCLTYAQQAEAQAIENTRRCKYEGARWSLSFADHFQWCRSPGANRVREQNERKRLMERCTIGSTSSALTDAPEVSIDEQKRRRLVNVSNRCSGTLLNSPVAGQSARERQATRYWVLTAAHCVWEVGADGMNVRSPAPDTWQNITVTAAWSADVYVARYVKLYIDHDIALIMLGHEASALEPTPTEPILLGGPLPDVDTRVRVFGRGLSLYATDASQTSGQGTYRWVDFPIRLRNDRGSVVSQNNGPLRQGILGGDSGGPWYVGADPYPSFLIGLSTGGCQTADASESAAAPWTWTTTTHWCFGSFLEPLLDDIRATIKVHPEVIDSSSGRFSGSAMLDDTDRPGNDIARLPMPGRNPEKCRAACLDNAQCHAWTYVRPGFQGDQGWCYLKSRASTNKVPNRCCISGAASRVARELEGVPPPTVQIPPARTFPAPETMLLEYDTDRMGGDYSNLTQTDRTPLSCRQACAADARCKAFTYVRAGFQGPSPRCYLKTSVPSATSNNCCVSGVK